MRLLLLAGLGGALGSAARYGIGVLIVRLTGPGYPWSTLLVNIVGCAAMGLFVTWLGLRSPHSHELRVFVATGVLGGFTTFSAFALDFAGLMDRGESTAAWLYLAASVGLSILGLYAGLALARLTWS